VAIYGPGTYTVYAGCAREARVAEQAPRSPLRSARENWASTYSLTGAPAPTSMW
jgi:hypothetical protein